MNAPRAGALGGRWSRTVSHAVLGLGLAAIPGLRSDGLAQTPKHELRISSRIDQVSPYRMAFELRMRAEYGDAEMAEGAGHPLIEALAAGIGARTVVEYEQRLAEVEPDGTTRKCRRPRATPR